MPYRFLEDIALADIAFEATGKTLEELFVSAALATTEVMVRNWKDVKHNIFKEVKLGAEDVERLLFDFLQEIIFYKDAELLLFSKFDIKIKEGKIFELTGKMYGEKLDMKRHDLIVDVKAVTYHKYEVEKTSKGWRARVILDI